MADSAQQYLAFVLADDWVSAAIWQPVGQKIQVLSTSRIIGLEGTKDTDLNNALDVALDDLGEDGLAIKQALFVVPHHWVKDDDLISSRKTYLKALTKDLMLEPMGFVVLSDSISAAETQQHGVDYTGAIIVDTDQYWDVILMDGGREDRVERVGRSGQLEPDMQELKARMSGSSPSRILFLSAPGRDTEATEQHLQNMFGVTPEPLSAESVTKQSVQLGGQEVLGTQEPSTLNTDTQENSPSVSAPQRDEDAPLLNQAPAGFAPPAFIKSKEFTESKPAAKTASDTDGADTSDPDAPRHNFTEPESLNPADEDTPEPKKEEDPEPTTAVDGIHKAPKTKRSLALPKLPHFKNIFSKTLFAGGAKKKWIILGLVGTVVLALLSGSYVWMRSQYSVQVNLWLSTDELRTTEDFLVPLSEEAEASDATAAPTLKAEIISETVSADKEVPTTGTKIIGEPAKGKVEITNKTEEEKFFPAGTVLTYNSLEFTLDEEVTIASASTREDASSRTTTFGTATIAVTAVGIGPEGNLDKDQTFTVANFDTSSYEATNPEPFSGGASREIQAVAQADIDQAVQDLKQAAQEQLQAKFSNMTDDQTIVIATDVTETTEINVSNDVGAEAKFVQVTVTEEGTGLRITPETVLETAQQLLQDQIETEQTLLPESVAIVPQAVQTAEGAFVVTAELSGKVVSQLSGSSIQEQIAGQHRGRAEQILASNESIDRQEVIVRPSWMQWFFSQIPSNQDRIELNIRIDQKQ